jgi:hypothetical protein
MENHGKPWTTELETLLLDSLKTESITECAIKLKRKLSAVESRLHKIAIELHKKGISKLEIENITKLSHTVINHIIYVHTLPNHNAEWDDSQDNWISNYMKKYGLSKCASLMGRTENEVHNRLLYIGLTEYYKNKSIKDICTKLSLSEEDFTKKILGLNDYVKFDNLEYLENPPYYVVINEMQSGVFSKYDTFRFITNGIKSKYKKCNTIEEVKQYIKTISESEIKTAAPLIKNKLPQKPSISDTPIILSEEQNKVIEDVISGNNILLLGSAGCGKSLLIRHIIQYYADKHINMAVTATTACAAILINGHTIHSYLGIGLAKESPTVLAKNLLYKFKSRADLLEKLNILIIDELSMLSGELLSKISEYLSILRNNEKPFGGIQIILCGDFYQLSPVQGSYAFQSSIWTSLNLSCHLLTKIYRQDGDTLFQEILERAKLGNITDSDLKILKNCKGENFIEGIKPTRLYAINASVDTINNEEYSKLDGEEQEYFTIYPNKESKAYADTIGIPKSLKLKIGTQVMITKNINSSQNIINGARGVVIKMNKESVIINTPHGLKEILRYETISENNNKLSYNTLPLRLAWAITIHKGQGATMDCVELDIGESIFAYGQAYVGLSRVKNLNSLHITKVLKKSFITNPIVIDFYKKINNTN